MLTTVDERVGGKTISIYDGFCKDEFLYKPYIKYYRGRTEAVKTGIPFKIHPPGFWTDFLDDDMENSYICVNGMAWLYYRLTIGTAVVYVAPELHAYVHHCMLVNGEKGPGKHIVERLLLGILLMGEPHDYRLPSIQLFTAPYQVMIPSPGGSPPPDPLLNPIPGEIYNATSLLMFGGETECILQKGRKKIEIRIRTDHVISAPEFPTNNDTFCRLSYQNTGENILDAGKLDYVMEALKHDEIIQTKGCYLPDKYTQRTEDIITARLAHVSDPSKLTPDPDIFDKTCIRWFEKIGRLPKSPDPNAIFKPEDFLPAAICTWSNPPDTAKDLCLPEKLAADIKEQKNLIEAKKKDPNHTPDDIKKLEVAIMLIKTRISQTNAFKLGVALGDTTAGVYKEVVDAWTNAKTAVGEVMVQFKAIEQAQKDIKKYKDDPTKKSEYDAAALALKTAEPLYQATSRKLTPLVSLAEAKRLQLDQQLQFTLRAYEELVAAFKIVQVNGMPKADPHPKLPLVPDVIVIKRIHAEYLKMDATVADPTKFESNPNKTCGKLPNKKEECKKIKPTKQRSCQLLYARMGKFIDVPPPPDKIPTPPVFIDWKPEDSWREDVLQIIEDIFSTACPPMLKREFSVAIGRIMRGYLTDMINGTIISKPPPDPTNPGPAEPMDLPARRPFWDQIMKALNDCKKREIRLYFKRFMNGEQEDYKFIKRYPNGSIEEMIIEHFIEQADEEFAFNFAIDSNWRMFATVLGICMPAYEHQIPLISAKFFTLYTEDFLYPLAKEWIMIRDNAVFKYILGEFYGGIGEQWSTLCMQASYLESGDVRYRPPRKLLVNGLTEANFFTSGPLTGTSGMYN